MNTTEEAVVYRQDIVTKIVRYRSWLGGLDFDGLLVVRHPSRSSRGHAHAYSCVVAAIFDIFLT
jgi:hypothetical protein